MALPSRNVISGSTIIGANAINVSRGEMAIMNDKANNPPKIVLVRYMMAGPTAMRTAPMSFVSFAISSPVRVRLYQPGSSRARCANKSSRRSCSMIRDTPLRISRI